METTTHFDRDGIKPGLCTSIETIIKSNCMKKFIWIIILGVFIQNVSQSQGKSTENIFIVTLDGMRWQEVFKGIDPSIMKKEKYARNSKELEKLFFHPNTDSARKKLMPFLWETIAKQGQLYGNRELNSEMNVSNTFWFSYPGYNEILTGNKKDIFINSNRKVYNPNKNVLEYINESDSSKYKIAAFGSWDLFPYIINEERNKIKVNAGYRPAEADSLTEKEIFLNELQSMIPGRWSSVRFDAFTHLYAMEYVKKHHPNVVFIGYGETDDFAHEGRYDQYLFSASRTDRFIEQLWNMICTDSVYRNKTTLIITTDHGRGKGKNNWKTHGRHCIHSDEVWMAVIGPDSAPLGEVSNNPAIYTYQIAATVLQLLNIDHSNYSAKSEPVWSILNRDINKFVANTKSK